MKSALRIRRGKAAAFCCLLLAVLAAVWSAAADPEENASDMLAVGNSFVRFSSENLELLSSRGEILCSLPFPYEGRQITAAGPGAAAWAPGAELVLLGGAGYMRVETEGSLLGVFGGECGAVCAICETPQALSVHVLDIRGEVFSLVCEDFSPLAAALSPDGGQLAVLSADDEGCAVRIFSTLSGEALELSRLDAPALSLYWDGSGLQVVDLDR